MSTLPPSDFAALAKAAEKAADAFKSEQARDLETFLVAIKAGKVSNLRRPDDQRKASEAIAKAPRQTELKTKSDDGPSAAAAAAAAAAAGPDTDNKAKDPKVVTLFGFNVKLSTPRILSAKKLARLEGEVSDLLGTLLEEIRKQRAEETDEDEMREHFNDLDGRLDYLQEKAAEEAADADDADPGDDLADSLSKEDKELFDLGSQICDRLIKHLQAAGYRYLPSVKCLWATFEKFGMTLDNEEIREDGGWQNDDERKAEFAKLLAAGADADANNLEADFPSVAEERERKRKRKAKADAERAKGNKAAKRAKNG